MSEYYMSHSGSQLDEAISKVKNGYILPSGQLEITSNGTFDVKTFEHASVDVDGQYYATSFNPSEDIPTATFNVGFEPKLFLIASVNSFVNNSSVYYISVFWHCADLTGSGYGEYSSGHVVCKNSSSQPQLISYAANSYYSYSNGVVTIKDTSHYFKGSTLYRVFAMA